MRRARARARARSADLNASALAALAALVAPHLGEARTFIGGLMAIDARGSRAATFTASLNDAEFSAALGKALERSARRPGSVVVT